MTIGLLMKSLLRYNVKEEDKGSQIGSKGMQNILDMIALKNKAQSIAKKANVKPKAFYQAIEENYIGLS